MAYNNRGWAWICLEVYDRAIADLNEAIRLDPRLALAYDSRACARMKKKAYDKAIMDMNEAIRLDPQKAEYYHGRSRVWQARGELDKALADLDEAIRLDPQDAKSFGLSAWIGATCPDARYRDGTKAVASATKSCELTGWKDAYHLDTLAAACAEAGDFDAAVKWQTQANALFTVAKVKTRGEERLGLYRARKPYRETKP